MSSTTAACIPEELREAADDLSNSSVPTENRQSADTAPAATEQASTAPHATSSVFSRDQDAPVHVVPMRVIHRPLPSELDEAKVLAFMDEMRVRAV